MGVAAANGPANSAPGALMAAEMAEQPDRLAALFARRSEIAAAVRALVPEPLAGTVLVARGSSDHAATVGRYLLEIATRRPVASASPSIHTLYRADVDFAGYLVVAVSQSGRTPEIAEVLDRAKATGGRTIAVTNDEASPLAQVADLLIPLDVGEERSVPATKTVTGQMAVFAMIAQALGDVGLCDAAEALPDLVADALADSGPPAHIAAWLAEATRFATVARGLLYGAAAECALKIEETTSLFASAFSSADLRHGPIAVASTGTPILAFAHPGSAGADVLELVADLDSRGATTRLAGPVPGTDLPWSDRAPETLAPILGVVRGQQVAFRLAMQLGRNPDSPAGLTKVTVT